LELAFGGAVSPVGTFKSAAIRDYCVIAQRRWLNQQSCCTSSPVSAEMGDRQERSWPGRSTGRDPLDMTRVTCEV